MKKCLHILLAVCLLLCAAACTQAPPQPGLTTEEPSAVSPAADSPAPETPEVPSDPETPGDAPGDTPDEPGQEPAETDSFDIYKAFLEENFDRISELCYGGIAGVGFIDLDIDGTPEMLLFDSGASAAMGVQLFDITDKDGAVECVSANMMDLGQEFGGTHYSTLYVNANYFDDFRLMRSDSGETRFFVDSGNGALDFSYSELIEFSGTDGILGLTSVLYRYDDFDIDSGETVSTHCSYLGESISADDYESRLSKFRSAWQDTGYEAFGVFIWEEKNYSTEYDGFMSMVNAAISGYSPLPE